MCGKLLSSCSWLCIVEQCFCGWNSQASARDGRLLQVQQQWVVCCWPSCRLRLWQNIPAHKPGCWNSPLRLAAVKPRFLLLLFAVPAAAVLRRPPRSSPSSVGFGIVVGFNCREWKSERLISTSCQHPALLLLLRSCRWSALFTAGVEVNVKQEPCLSREKTAAEELLRLEFLLASLTAGYKLKHANVVLPSWTAAWCVCGPGWDRCCPIRTDFMVCRELQDVSHFAQRFCGILLLYCFCVGDWFHSYSVALFKLTRNATIRCPSLFILTGRFYF